MSENLTAFVYLTILASFIYLLLCNFSKKIGYSNDLKYFFGFWFLVTAAAFFSNDYWIFCSIVLLVLLYIRTPDVSLRISLYVFLLLSLPTLGKTMLFFGIIEKLFHVTWPQVVIAGLLLPLILKSKSWNNSNEASISSLDRVVAIFILYIAMLSFRDTTVTEGFRQAFYYFFLLYLPYYITSRALSNTDEIVRVAHAVYIIVLLMAAIGIFSSIKNWHPYTSITAPLGLPFETINPYKYRAGFLRASSAYGAINLGLLIISAFAIGTYLHRTVRSKVYLMSHNFVLLTALVFTFSRGPWVGFAGMLLAMFIVTRNKSQAIVKGIIALIVCTPILLFSGFSDTILELLPFVGTSSSDTVSYRELLLEVSLEQISDFPLFGSTYYLTAPRMQILMQGEGIIDIVNTYLEIALQFGYIGLVLFLTFGIGIPLKLFSYRKKVSASTASVGNILFMILMAVLVVIGTVSTLGNPQIFPFVFTIFGISVAYMKICRVELKAKSKDKKHVAMRQHLKATKS